MTINPIILNRRSAYIGAFDNPDGRKVLADLKRFCRANTSAVDVDNVNTTMLLNGRREVWLRIMAYLNISEEEIFNLTEEPFTVNE